MNKLSLSKVEWKEFTICNIFNTDIRGKRLKVADREIGDIPLITAGENNNGISSFINNPKHKEYSNAITLDMFANAFYQSGVFKCDDNITILKNTNINKYSAIFIVSQLKKLKVKYSYGNQVRPNRLSKDKILLPINEKGEPNWDFMENYIKQIMNRQKSQIISYYKSQLSNTTYWEGLKNSNIEWKSFKVYDVFKTFVNKNKLQTPTGSYINKTLLEKSNIPRITVKGINNGVDSFSNSKNSKIIFFNNFISVSFLGSVFYHPYKASIDMKVHALIPLNIELNKYIAAFLIPIIRNNISFSSYGNQLSSTDLAQLTLVLPVDEKGEPNWKYMENHVKQKLHLQAKQIINYYEN